MGRLDSWPHLFLFLFRACLIQHPQSLISFGSDPTWTTRSSIFAWRTLAKGQIRFFFYHFTLQVGSTFEDKLLFYPSICLKYLQNCLWARCLCRPSLTEIRSWMRSYSLTLQCFCFRVFCAPFPMQDSSCMTVSSAIGIYSPWGQTLKSLISFVAERRAHASQCCAPILV